MKLRPRYERVHRSKPQAFGAAGFPLDAMQPGSSICHSGQGNSDGTSSCPGKGSGEGSCQRGGDIRIQLSSPLGETEENASPRQTPRLGTQSRSHAHSRSEARGTPDGALEMEEQSGSSLSELRYLFHWLHKSLPYLLILSVKLLMQHITGISLGIGLLTTFMYANKSIVNQVFLRERCSKLQCASLLVFLTGSSLLLYYTFRSQSLHYSLILLSPAADFMNFWEVLWIVGITDFVLKFLFMSFKCIVLLLPSFLMSFKSKGYWYMLLEELCQYYRTIVPVPVWFRYFIGSKELDGALGWSFGVLLALLYLILKLLSFFGHLKNFRQVLRIFYTRPHDRPDRAVRMGKIQMRPGLWPSAERREIHVTHQESKGKEGKRSGILRQQRKSYGVAASRRQCAEVDDICSICQAEFQKPVLLICQHIFCEECIALWFHREKTCPLCRTAIADHIQKWKDGATSVQLQVY